MIGIIIGIKYNSKNKERFVLFVGVIMLFLIQCDTFENIFSQVVFSNELKY
ncbi:hypothetical protein SAMN04487762_0861 [Polaribacter sp. Hel1_33_78]|jgi:Ni/Fe-hydrogenase subunit HybB-like protein|nr:hypothetical protein SAMN04487762_0861 [Polaribacter sp. Hel1_33_78]